MGISTLLLGAALAVASSAPAAPATPRLLATPQFRHYGIDDGLPTSNIYTVVQDRRGMLWLGTRAGLVRFDGVTFKVYRHDRDDPASLGSDDVSSVVADRRGRLWAGGEGSGVNLLDPASGGFRHWKHDRADPHSLAGDDVMTMATDADGSLWVGLYGFGLDHMTTPGHFEHLRHVPGDPASLASDNVLSLHRGDDGRLWIGTDAGLDLREPDGSLRHVRFEGAQAPRVWRIDGDAGEVRAATSDGLFAIGRDAVGRRIGAGKLPQHNVFSSVRGADGSLWVGSMMGLYLLDGDGRCTHFPPQPLMPGGQPGTLIWGVTRDREGGLWLATQNAGLAYMSPDWREFTRFAHLPDDAGSLAGSRIRALAADGHGKLLVGGINGQLDRLDPVTGHVVHLAGALGVAPNSITALGNAGADGTWVGLHNGLGLFDGTRLRKVDDPRLRRGARWLVADADGVAYAAPTGQGVFRVDPHALRATPLSLAYQGEAARETTDLAMHGGRLWRASRAGLSRLAADGRRLIAVRGVSAGPVQAMGFAAQDLWLARNNSLEHYRLHDGVATLRRRIDDTDAGPGAALRALTVDARGRVWLFSEVGLWRYDPATGGFRSYGREDGLPSAEFTSSQLVHMPDGTVYAGTLGGVVGFRPGDVRDRPRPPALVLASARVRRDGHDVTLPLDGRVLRLRWSDRDLRVTARALSYIDPERNHYRFRLLGFDPDWIDTGSRGVREFAGLGAGSYRLKVQASGPSRAWAGLDAPLLVEVAAPPWNTPWAWFSYALVGAALGWMAFAAWRRRVEQHHRVQMSDQQRLLAEQASAAKTRFLATLGHEIRTPMTGVLGMAELLLDAPIPPRERGYARAIRHSGELLLKLVNDALDMARIEAGRFELEPAPLDPRALLDDVAQMEAGLAAGKQLSFTVDVAAAVPARLLGDALRIKQILLNLANNALKFTERGGARIDADYRDGHLLLRVSDTGPGIPEASRARLFQRFEQVDGPQRQAGSGLGLAICRELVALMHGRIELDSTLGEGTRFTVHLPLPPVASAAPATAAAPAGPVPARQLLLVEDDATVAEVVRGLLQAQGHHVTHAAHGLAALGELEHGAFDAVLLDLDLPGIDGFRLAQMIRQRESGDRHLPIVAVTARSGGDEEQRARAAGMDAFLRKPLTGAQLAAILENLDEQSQPACSD